MLALGAYGTPLMTAAGAAIGVGQTILIQQVVEPTNTNWIPQIKGFGRPSAIIGIATGVAAIALALYAGKQGGFGRLAGITKFAPALLSYGGAALASGLITGAMSSHMPVQAARVYPSRAAARSFPASRGNAIQNNML